MSIQIAIDGPSGAGKSTMAKRLAQEKQFIYLDTGAMYRSFGLYAIRHGVAFDDWELSRDSEQLTDLLPSFSLAVEYREGSQHVLVNGEDFTGLIRTPAVSLAASKVAAVPAVRKKLVEIQRRIAARQNVVMDGRDIGSYVLPQATVKIFLTASPEARARRRFEELRQKGDLSVTYEEVLQDMRFRDENDSTREFAPLVCAPDAITIDTTDCGIEETMAKIRETVEQRV